MILVIIVMHKFNMNPDNYATAIAASIGDIVTSFMLGIVSQFIFNQTVLIPSSGLASTMIEEGVNYYQDLASPWMAIVIIALFITSFPLWAMVAVQDNICRRVLFTIGSWIPIMVAMFISFGAGACLRLGAAAYRHMALFQPLISG